MRQELLVTREAFLGVLANAFGKASGTFAVLEINLDLILEGTASRFHGEGARKATELGRRFGLVLNDPDSLPR